MLTNTLKAPRDRCPKIFSGTSGDLAQGAGDVEVDRPFEAR
jgi:hypothetical protein